MFRFPVCSLPAIADFARGLTDLSRLGRLHREFRGFPGRDASGNLADVCEAVPLQDTGRDRRSISAGAVDDERTIRWQFAQALAELVQRNAETAVHILLCPLARITNVDGERRSSSQSLRRKRRADALGRRGEV